MRKKNTTPLYDFEFSIHGYDFVSDVYVFMNERTERLEIYDLDIEGKEMFDVQYIIEYLENELDELLWDVYSKGLPSEEDERAEAAYKE
jgi:hypothetical protein